MAGQSSAAAWLENRKALRAAFRAREGWQGAMISPVGEDSAQRRYFRLEQDGKSAILMESVPDDDPLATPGHKIRDFIRIAAFLRESGLHTPAIYAADEKNGYVLLEDFGDVSFKKALEQGQPPQEVYTLATDVLAFIRTHIKAGSIALPDYCQSHVHAGRRRLVDWYIPAQRETKNPDGLAEEYLALWQEIEQSLPPCPQGFLHIDYHAENLMLLPAQKELSRCGLLDFQGAMTGPLPYDLANLLEDVRTDVPPALRDAMRTHYCRDMNPEDRTVFENWYRVLATQFHCRVAGQFIRLALKDDKPRYLDCLPRVTAYLREGLRHPVLKPMENWIKNQGMDFQSVPPVSETLTLSFIREDAF